MSNTNKSDKSDPTSSGRRYFRRSKSGSSKPAGDSSSSSSPNETKSKSGSSSEKSRKPRRKSRSESRSSRSRANEERSQGKGRRESNRSLRRRSGDDTKRRRRRRRHSSEEETVEKNRPDRGPSIIDAIKREYRSPQDVYSYTHIIRPDQRDAYEFRSDHFSNTSRHLEDYSIDLSSILNEAGEITLKQFFQEMPEDVDFETDGREVAPDPAPENHDEKREWADETENDHQRDALDIEANKSRAKSHRAERRTDSKRKTKKNVDDDLEEYFADDEKSLEQIYDELEMFTEDMEI